MIKPALQKVKNQGYGNLVFLPKVGWLGFRKSRQIEGSPRNLTVSRRGDHWFISIQTEKEIDDPVHPSTSAVGIDPGVARFATLSDGTVFEPLNSFGKLENSPCQGAAQASWKSQILSPTGTNRRPVLPGFRQRLPTAATTICTRPARRLVKTTRLSCWKT